MPGAVFGPATERETGQARELLPLLDQTMLLLLTGRGFDGEDFLAAVAATKARHLPAESFLPVIGSLPAPAGL